jgi:hypothetical protein
LALAIAKGCSRSDQAVNFFFKCADISELVLSKTTSIAFPNGKNDLLNFEITIKPDEGYYT